MTPTKFIHHFRCECGRQDRALTGMIFDCVCGRSRQYIRINKEHRTIHFLRSYPKEEDCPCGCDVHPLLNCALRAA